MRVKYGDVELSQDKVIHFTATTAYVRKYDIIPKPIRLTSGHRGTAIKLELGYLVIERKWYPKS